MVHSNILHARYDHVPVNVVFKPAHPQGYTKRAFFGAKFTRCPERHSNPLSRPNHFSDDTQL